MSGLEKGCVHVYTGNGKGKTTAAIGQAVRAAGAGLKTFILQFMKEFPYSEITALKNFPDFIQIEQFGGDDFVLQKRAPNKDELARISAGIQRAEEQMLSGKFDIVILDEACVSIYFGVLREEEILDFISKKPGNVELIITGRYCTDKIIAAANLVTEMKEVKHYYRNGVTARKGIES